MVRMANESVSNAPGYTYIEDKRYCTDFHDYRRRQRAEVSWVDCQLNSSGIVTSWRHDGNCPRRLTFPRQLSCKTFFIWLYSGNTTTISTSTRRSNSDRSWKCAQLHRVLEEYETFPCMYD